VQTNLNIGLVADGGQPLGSFGAVQTDSRFGDLRFAATSQTNSTYALGTPFNWTSTTWSGDVQLNNHLAYGIASPNTYDLHTIALHEIGHALGLQDAVNPMSVMYASYGRARRVLFAGDIANVQANSVSGVFSVKNNLRVER
jgi:predicted lipase